MIRRMPDHAQLMTLMVDGLQDLVDPLQQRGPGYFTAFLKPFTDPSGRMFYTSWLSVTRSVSFSSSLSSARAHTIFHSQAHHGSDCSPNTNTSAKSCSPWHIPEWHEDPRPVAAFPAGDQRVESQPDPASLSPGSV